MTRVPRGANRTLQDGDMFPGVAGATGIVLANSALHERAVPTQWGPHVKKSPLNVTCPGRVGALRHVKITGDGDPWDRISRSPWISPPLHLSIGMPHLFRNATAMPAMPNELH